MRNYDRTSKTPEQETLEKHLKKAHRELLQVSKVIGDLALPRAEKKLLRRKLDPLLRVLENTKIVIPKLKEKSTEKKEDKGVKGANRRRKKESK